MGWIKKKILFKALHNKKVQVGFFDAKTATIAFFNEFGHLSRSGSQVPERAFMRNSLKEFGSSYKKQTAHRIHQLISGMLSEPHLLQQSGEFWKKKIEHSIAYFDEPKDLPSTIAKKGKDDTLVDTGEMLISVEYKVGKS